MLNNNILADLMSELNLNISILLYELVLISLNKVIKKVKIIKIDQKNVTEAI